MKAYQVLRKTNNFISLLIEIMCLICFVVLGFILYDNYMIQQDAMADYITQYKPQINEETGEFSLAELQAINPDVVAWVTVEDTPLDYPILQGNPEFTYLNHDMEGNSCLTGSLYIGVRANRYFEDDYTIVYGHHVAGGAMLGCLDYYEDDEGYLEEHSRGTLITENQTYEIKFLAVARIDAYNDLYAYTTIEDFNTYIQEEDFELVRGSLEDIDEDSKLIIFSTCSTNGTTDRKLLIGILT